MRYGLVLPNFGHYSDVRLLADLAHEAEEAGWDGFFLTDTIQMIGYEESPICDPWIALAAVAVRTERIKIGLRVAAPTRRRPWQMAGEALTLDHLSNGRFILGVGAGDEHDRGFAAFGEEMDMKKRARMLEEGLEIIQRLWSGEPFSYSGEHYQVHEIALHPTPVQTPRIPIWLGWVWPRLKPMERAARWDGATPFAMHDDGTYAAMTPSDIRQLKQFIAERRPDDEPFDIVIDGPIFEAVHDEQARATLRANAEAGATWSVQFVFPEVAVDDLRAAIRQGPPAIESDLDRTPVAFSGSGVAR
jgi:alkanesulfonate monooxygenase SsuD/methylene tetrahydromethanopterin reductase-like flavin-dependent oxidoreductase (luciferase family)